MLFIIYSATICVSAAFLYVNDKKLRAIESEILGIYSSGHDKEYKESQLQVSDALASSESLLSRRIIKKSKFLVHTDYLDKKYEQFRRRYMYRQWTFVFLFVCFLLLAIYRFLYEVVV